VIALAKGLLEQSAKGWQIPKSKKEIKIVFILAFLTLNRQVSK
jgi:hypothetical protein